jgi:hypothetical protein
LAQAETASATINTVTRGDAASILRGSRRPYRTISLDSKVGARPARNDRHRHACNPARTCVTALPHEDGRRLRALTVVDVFTREALAIEVDAFRAAARAWLGEIARGRASASSATIRFPGERAFARRQEALARGWMMIDGSVWGEDGGGRRRAGGRGQLTRSASRLRRRVPWSAPTAPHRAGCCPSREARRRSCM